MDAISSAFGGILYVLREPRTSRAARMWVTLARYRALGGALTSVIHIHSDSRNVSGRRWPASGTYRGAFRRNVWRRSVLLRLCRKPFFYFRPRKTNISAETEARDRVSA